MFHLGITGSRYGLTEQQGELIVAYLKNTQMESQDRLVFHHGCCEGVDEFAHYVAYDLRIPVIGHPPIETAWCMSIVDDGRYFRELKKEHTYLTRNRHIVDSISTLIVVPKETERRVRGGTWYTYRYAKKQNVNRVIFWPDGSATHEFIV